mgnify:CR=1 FL=1
MILYITGLTGVSREMVEAGRIDGASGFTMLWHVILPQLRPATLIAIVRVRILSLLNGYNQYNAGLLDEATFQYTLNRTLEIYENCRFGNLGTTRET